MEPLNQKSQIAQEYGLLPADARQQLHYNRPYAKMASDQHLPLSGQVSYFADEGTLVKQDVSLNSCNISFVVLQEYLQQHLIVKLSG